MELIDRARGFIEHGGYGELLPLLVDCVSSGSQEGMVAAQLLARDVYGGDTYNLMYKAPAAYSLLAWEKHGLAALVENALETPSSKNFSMAFQLLACAAEGRDPDFVLVRDGHLRQAVANAVGDWNVLASEAREQLRVLMLSIEDDDDVGMYVSTALMGLAMGSSGAIRHLSSALAFRSVALGPRTLDEYDELMLERAGDEPAFQRFFEGHPLMLDPRAFQVWGQPDFHGKFEPDFIIRTYDNRYLVVEIETPDKILVTKQRQLSADTTHAISQVLGYQEYLRTHLDAATETFPGFTTAAGLVVIGCESQLSDDQKAVLRSENQSRPNITIVGFDVLSNTAKAVTENVVHGIPGAIKNARLS